MCYRLIASVDERRSDLGLSVYKRNGFWVLRYRVTINQAGELKTVQKAKQLAPIDANYKNKKSVQSLAQDILRTVNEYRRTPETVTTIGSFVTDVYLPFVSAQKRPSTYRGYRDMWEDHLKPRYGDTLMRDVRTCDIQRWLETVAAEDTTKTGGKLSHGSLKHIKSLISGVFAHAKRQGFSMASTQSQTQPFRKLRKAERPTLMD